MPIERPRKSNADVPPAQIDCRSRGEKTMIPTDIKLSQVLTAWVFARESTVQKFKQSSENIKLRNEISKLVYQKLGGEADHSMCELYAQSFLSELFWKHEEWEIAMDGDKLLDFVDSIAEGMTKAQRKADRRGELYRLSHSQSSAS